MSLNMMNDMNQYANALQESNYSNEIQNLKAQHFQQLADIKGQLLGTEGSNWSNAGETITTLGVEGLLGKGISAAKSAVQGYLKDKAEGLIDQAKSQVQSAIDNVKSQISQKVEDIQGTIEDNVNNITGGNISADFEPTVDEGLTSFVRSVASNALDMRQNVGSIIDNAANSIKNLGNSGQNFISNASSELETMRNGILPEFNNDAFASRFNQLYGDEFEDGVGTMQRALTQGQSFTKQIAEPPEISNAPAPEDIEMTTFNESSLAPAEDVASTIATEAATDAGSMAGSIGLETGTDIAASVAADATAEAAAGAAAAAGIGASDVLGPLGLLVGAVAGIVSLVEGHKKEEEEKQEEEQALLHPPTYGFTNPSAQFL